MPLGNLCHSGGKTGEKLGAQIDIINTLSMSMQWSRFSLSYYYTILWMIDNSFTFSGAS